MSIKKIRDLLVVFRNPEFRDGKMSEHSGSVGNPKSVFGTPLAGLHLSALRENNANCSFFANYSITRAAFLV